MKKTTAIPLALVAAVLAIGAPILLAIHLAGAQGLGDETDRVLSYAKDILRRSDETADQVAEGIARLTATHFADPCSEESVALMRQIDLDSSYIQAIGHVAGDRLVCSSLDQNGQSLPLGPADLKTPRGVAVRSHVKLPFAPDHMFIVLEKDGYAAIIHKDLPIDTTTVEEGVGLAIFSLYDKKPLSARGFISPDWFGKLGSRHEVAFSDGAYVVAVVKSNRYLTAAVAAVPLAYVNQRASEFAVRLVPFGLASGIALVLMILRLARMRLAMPAVIKTALRRKEFFLLYQPIVDLRTGKWVGAEALIRWRRSADEVMRPDLFIPIAEEAGLIRQITERVIGLVAQDAAGLFQQHPDFHVAINLSPADMHSGHTIELLRRLADEVHAGPGNLIVEATERGLMQAKVANGIIDEIRAGGIAVAIDDFGTGYSGLSCLQTFTFDFLKIDKSFVETIGTEAFTSHVVHHIIEMAKALKLNMIAEGVETEAQARFLYDHGVEYAQGWLFGKPMPMAELKEKLSAYANAEHG